MFVVPMLPLVLSSRKLEPYFVLDEFLDGAVWAFGSLLSSYQAGDTAKMSAVLSPKHMRFLQKHDLLPAATVPAADPNETSEYLSRNLSSVTAVLNALYVTAEGDSPEHAVYQLIQRSFESHLLEKPSRLSAGVTFLYQFLDSSGVSRRAVTPWVFEQDHSDCKWRVSFCDICTSKIELFRDDHFENSIWQAMKKKE